MQLPDTTAQSQDAKDQAWLDQQAKNAQYSKTLGLTPQKLANIPVGPMTAASAAAGQAKAQPVVPPTSAMPAMDPQLKTPPLNTPNIYGGANATAAPEAPAAATAAPSSSSGGGASQDDTATQEHIAQAKEAETPDIGTPPAKDTGATNASYQKPPQSTPPEVAPNPVGGTQRATDAASAQADEAAAQQTQDALTTKAKTDPSIGQKIADMAKNFGMTAFQVIQAVAYGQSGSDKPLYTQLQHQEQLMKAQKDAEYAQQLKITDLQQKQAQAINDADHTFQQNLVKAQEDFAQKMADAKNQQERDAAAKEMAFKADEAAKDRAARIEETHITADAYKRWMEKAANPQQGKKSLEQIVKETLQK